MDNKIINKTLNELKKDNKIQTFTRNINRYKFMNVDYKKLKPLTYTIATKNTNVITKYNNKKETSINIKRGDYIICGHTGEKYGLPLEKIMNTYNLNTIETKKVYRKGYKLTHKNIGNKPNITITASWGEKQKLKTGDYILLETFNNKYYGVEQHAFKKSYKVVKKTHKNKV